MYTFVVHTPPPPPPPPKKKIIKKTYISAILSKDKDFVSVYIINFLKLIT